MVYPVSEQLNGACLLTQFLQHGFVHVSEESSVVACKVFIPCYVVVCKYPVVVIDLVGISRGWFSL